MFYDPIEKTVLDFVNGQQDLDKQILRTIGDPDERFGEDYLRMLRAVRFAVKLDFRIEPTTWMAIQAHAPKIISVSAERIAAELEQILSHPARAAGVGLLVDSGLAEAIFDVFKDHPAAFGKNVLQHLPKAVDFPLALASLWSGFETKTALAQCKKLKLSNDHLKRHGDFQTQAADARTIFLGLAGSAKSHSGSQRQKRSALKENPKTR
ncbi:MAG: tRNA nucleotidyltransferase/poly(A) polymerase family protein, partial [Planctomycetota bacterium]|jgi:poly(A) polymerase